jgi:hypothetical protein
MDLDQLQQWIVVISGAITFVSVAVGVWMALREYRLKLQAETRQQTSAQVEADIRLNTLFLDLMKFANGRSGYEVSDTAVEWGLEKLKDASVFEQQDSRLVPDWEQVAAVNRILEDLAILRLPVGSAMQDAAVATVAILAERYPQLREAARCGLESLQEPYTSRVAERYLANVRKLPPAPGPP